MPRQIWFPEPSDVALIIARLRAASFPTYDRALAADLPGFSGVETNDLLLSALGIVRHHYYASITDKAGALLRSMIKDHPFPDGNKRIGMVVTMVFLNRNGYQLTATNEEMSGFAIRLAASAPAMEWREVAAWIAGHTTRVRRPRLQAPPSADVPATLHALAAQVSRELSPDPPKSWALEA